MLVARESFQGNPKQKSRTTETSSIYKDGVL